MTIPETTKKADVNPLDDIRALILNVPQPDTCASEAVLAACRDFKGPKPVLGRWEKPVAWLAGWQGTDHPSIARPLIAVFAGSHAIAKVPEGGAVGHAAQARIAEVTSGAAVVRGIASRAGAAFKVYEMGPEYPAADITQEPSLSPRDCAAAVAFGMETIAEGADIIALGNAGYGSAVAAAAVALGLYGGSADYWAGGKTDRAYRTDIVNQAINRHSGSLNDPLEVLRSFGGRDLAGLIGAIIAARHQSVPIILDGFVVCAAAAVIHAVNPDAISHCIAGHLSAEPAHGALLDRMGLSPLHNFELSLGDGTGAAFALGTLQSAVSGFETLTQAT